MARPPNAFPRVLTRIVTTALVSAVCALALAPAASARVSIVPGTLQGGATQSFAVRLANERSGVSTTRLELTFPADAPIPQAAAAKVRGWTATVTMVPLEPPVTVGDEVLDEAVGSIVWEGGEVAPKQFEQFLVTAGPLPPDGRLVFTATQGYSDGSEDRWAEPAAGKGAGAPTIGIVGGAGTAGDQPADRSAAGSVAAQTDGAPVGAVLNNLLLWALVAAAVLVVAAAFLFVGYRSLGLRDLMAMSRSAGSAAKGLLERAGRPLRERVGKR